MHVVHYNSKYNTFDEAVNQTNGLHVLAFLFEVNFKHILIIHENKANKIN